MSKYILFLAKLKGEGRPFWSGQAWIYLLNYLLHVGVTIIKVFIILLLLVGIGNTLAISKTNQQVLLSISFQMRYILFLAKLKGRGKPFLEGARQEVTLWDYLQEHLVVIRDEKISPFVKLETILPLLYFFSTPLQVSTAAHGVSMLNLWIDSRTCQK